MGTVNDHPNPVHLLHNCPTELGQPDVLVVASASNFVIEVVGEKCLTYAKPMKEAHHVEVAVECAHALEVERNCQLAFALSPLHIVGRIDH